MLKKRNFYILAFIALITLLFWAFYNGLVVKNYIIYSDKISKSESIRIVLITDLHSHVYGKNQTKPVSLIKQQKPDIIALAGDIADDEAPIEGTKLFLEGLKGFRPIYYVTGNHEFWSNDIKNIKDTIRKYDVHILENNYEQIKVKNSNFVIGGIDDPDVVMYEKPTLDLGREMNDRFFKLKDKSDFKILLAHRPELIELYKEFDFDLVLSGHSHGGQVRIPFILNGLLAPNQGWFLKYAGGVYKHGSLTHIVSRGVSYNPRLPRIFNPPEIVTIDINGNTKQINATSGRGTD
jgi:predicted MPP superfamily phosphohydrolase